MKKKNNKGASEFTNSLDNTNVNVFKGRKNPFINDNLDKINIRIRKCLLLTLIIFPLAFSFFLVSLHTKVLINNLLSIILLLISIGCIVSIFLCCKKIFSKGNFYIKKIKKSVKVVITVMFIMYYGSALFCLFLLYGPIDNFRIWSITTLSESKRVSIVLNWFYSYNTIQDVLENNRIIESGESTNPDLIEIEIPDYNNNIYENEYEEQILTREENQIYKVISVERTNMKGKLVVVYEPSKVKLATSNYFGHTGQYLIDILKNNDGLIGMNASAFTFASNGGVAQGTVIVDGKVISDEWRKPGYGGMIGITYDNKLYLGYNMTPEAALKANIRDAVEYGPFLVVNGVPSYAKGTSGGKNPRSVIGQRKDGIILFLVIDGRRPGHSNGATFAQLSEIMMDYGAYNAANLDGGTSAAIAEDGKLLTIPDNKISTKIPNAWIVVE